MLGEDDDFVKKEVDEEAEDWSADDSVINEVVDFIFDEARDWVVDNDIAVDEEAEDCSVDDPVLNEVNDWKPEEARD